MNPIGRGAAHGEESPGFLSCSARPVASAEGRAEHNTSRRPAEAEQARVRVPSPPFRPRRASARRRPPSASPGPRRASRLPRASSSLEGGDDSGRLRDDSSDERRPSGTFRDRRLTFLDLSSPRAGPRLFLLSTPTLLHSPARAMRALCALRLDRLYRSTLPALRRRPRVARRRRRPRRRTNLLHRPVALPPTNRARLRRVPRPQPRERHRRRLRREQRRSNSPRSSASASSSTTRLGGTTRVYSSAVRSRHRRTAPSLPSKPSPPGA